MIKYRRWFVPEDKIDNSLFLSWSLPINRQLFEQRLEQLEQKAEDLTVKQPLLSKIMMKAKLEGRQLTSGQGFFTFHPQSGIADFVRLDPLSLAISAPHWADDTEASLFCDSEGTTQLMIPPQQDKNVYDSLRFQWSLQSRRNYRNEIVFDLALPSCLSIELQIDLPTTMTLTTTAGLVLPQEKDLGTDPELCTWRVLLGHHSRTTLTITTDKTSSAVKQKTAFRQLLRHQITPEGLHTFAQIVFDNIDSRPTELTLQLDAPLRPVDVKYGDRSVSWTRSTPSAGITEIQIDLSPFAEEEIQELTVESLGPLLENSDWLLPRIRVTSSDMFWMSTRCAVYVDAPLRTRHLVCRQGVQRSPRFLVDWAKQEMHVFQFFQEDAQIELGVFYAIPRVFVNSVVQADWNNAEIRSTVVLECSVTEGERFILNFPVSPHWIIDSITSYSPSTGTLSTNDSPVVLWNMLDDKTASVQLQQPLKPQSPVFLQLVCRFTNNSQKQFRLAELSPLTLTQQYGETHYIATQLNSSDYAFRFNADTSIMNVPQTVRLGTHSLELEGNRFLLDSRTRDLRFELERIQPRCTVDISGNVVVGGKELLSSFHFRCTPIDSSIDRVFVHFTPSNDQSAAQPWTWSLVGDSDSSHPLRARKLSPNELEELLPLFEPRNRNEDLVRGEIWEIRLHEMQSMPFELIADSMTPLADSMVLTLASIPLASYQQGKLTIEAPQQFGYQVVNSRLSSLPIAPISWKQYQHTRAAFLYDPQDELRRSQFAPLMLKKIAENEQFTSAWIWSLRLDSQYEPEGMVRNKALFLLENKGKEFLKVTLPPGIEDSHVSVVWLDSQQIPWQYNEEQRTIDIALPENQRFVSIVLEYLYQDSPLVQQRKLRPRYPSADVPILSGSWISWFPQEFEVSLRRDSDDNTDHSENRLVLSKALDYLTAGTTYRTFFASMWDVAFHSQQRRKEAETVAQYFFEAAANELQTNPTATWGDLIGNEKVFSDVRLSLSKNINRVERLVETKLLIDAQALTFLGITPATPIEDTTDILEQDLRERFERVGLVLLIALRTRSDGIKEYVFALTTPATLSLNRQLQSMPVGHCVQLVPFAFIDTLSQSATPWIPAPRWLSETPLSAIPWLASAQTSQQSALTSDWNAYTLPMNVEQSLYIVHRQKMAALQWLAFLTFELISTRKPFSSPAVLLILLIVFEVTARSVAPCYAGIPSGAFLGVLVALAFVYIRFQTHQNAPVPPEHMTHHDSTECSSSFVQTSLLVRSLFLCVSLALFGWLAVSVSAQPFTEKMQEFSQQKEPYRVFYPTDSEHQVTGDQVILPAEFYDILFRNIESANPASVTPQWSIVKAVYQGSLAYGTSGKLECSDDFKAVYDVHLDSSHTIISLPNTLPVQGRYFWDSKPIFPIDHAQKETLLFLIENETPGKHVLEIALSPQISLREADETFQISFSIPKVPNSTLRLNVPPEMPTMLVHEAQGAVTDHTTLSPIVTAELGTISQLSLSWIDDQNKSKTLLSEVEQFFRIQAKPSQIELNALFRFRIDNGKVRYLTIQNDPRWSRSGQFQCDEHQLAQRVESNPELRSYNRFSVSPYNTTQIDFQSPVSGIVTLRADFVLLDSSGIGSGIGNLRLPEFKALQSRITRSMLAVYVDPNLEANGPVEGRTSGFESGWQGTPVNIFPFSGEGSILEYAGAMFTEPSDASQERPVMEYDLTETEPTWILNVRAKKTIPTAAVTQSIQFDAGESQVHALGDFTTDSNVFQQYFTADPSIHIETVEVKNALNEVVECRFQQTAPETMPERYVIFFKNPVIKKYTISIHGSCKTPIQDTSSQQPVPMLTFDDAQITSHSLIFFKTSAVIADIVSPETSGWLKSETSSTMSSSFPHSALLGTWQKTNSIALLSQEPSPLNVTTSEDIQNETLQFALLPNHPKVKSKTVLLFQPSDSDDLWSMTLDYRGNVSGGELKAFQFQWDDRLGSIQSIEPPTDHSLGQFEGKPTLVLTPDKPIQGEHSYKIVVSLNLSGTTISLPSVQPLPSGIEEFESELLVDLPRQWNQNVIPWELNLLEVVDDQTTDDSRLLYRAVDSNFKIAVNQMESRLFALFYDIGYLVRQNGTIIGVATIDLRNRGQDNFILQMPQGYEPIQISSSGVLLDRTQLEDKNRWKINIGMSHYPQRISVLFRASLPHPLKQWNRKKIATSLQCPFLEGIAVQETIWTVTFEGNVPLLNIASDANRQWIMGANLPPNLLGSEVTELGQHRPLSGREAALSLIGINLVREYNLLRVLNSLSGTASTQQAEAWHWFAHWSEEWNTIGDKMDFQVAHLTLTSQDVKPKLIARPIVSASKQEENTGIAAFVETISTNSQNALKDYKSQRVSEKFGATADTVSKQSVPILNSQVYWQGRISERMQYLFGMEEGALHAIHLTSQPSDERWKYRIADHIWLWIGLALLLPIVLLLAVRWVHWMELWLQFPHFWGMIIGVLLWTFLPQSFVGLIIIALTFISFFRPSWTRHRSMPTQF